MTDYIEKTLHCPVSAQEYSASRKIPLAISSNYTLELVTISERECIFAKPDSELNLSIIRRHQKQMEKLTDMICVLYFQKINAYMKDHLIKEGIPFVVENKQIYLPFLGLALSDGDERTLKPCGQISYLTQKLLLTSIYEKWKDVSVSAAAEKLSVTKMSVTRCYDEIEVFGLPYIRKRSRTRLFSADSDREVMWENLRGILRNPVLQQFSLKNDLNGPKVLSGMSALGFYSMLDDSSYPIYEVSKKEIRKILEENEQIYFEVDMPGCVIQEVGYEISFGSGQAADPLSVSLMLTDSEMDDPRVSKAVEEMLEETVWLKD